MKKTKLIDIFLPYQRDFFLNSEKRKLWLASRQIGKSFAIAGALAYNALKRPNGLSLCISTGARAASEIIRKTVQFAQAIKGLSGGAIDYTSSYDKVVFSNGGRVMSLPGSTDGSNLRGYSAGLVAIDEAAYIPHLEEIMQAIGPTLTRDPDSQLIMASSAGGRGGYFYDAFANGSDEWWRQTTTIEDAIHDGLKVDINALRALTPDEQAFRQEYMCEWADSDSGMLGEYKLDSYGELPKGGYYVFGMDIGRKKDNTAIVVLYVLGEKKYVVDVVTMTDAPYAVQKTRLSELRNRYSPIGCYIDSTGIGSAFAEDVNHTLDSRFRGMQFTASNKTPMFEALRADVFDKRLYTNANLSEKLNSELATVRRVIDDSGHVYYRADRSATTGHADSVSALVLAIKAAKDFKQSQSMPISLCGFRTRF